MARQSSLFVPSVPQRATPVSRRVVVPLVRDGAVHELLGARRGQLLPAERGLELPEAHAEGLLLRDVPVDVGVLDETVGLRGRGVGPVELDFELELGLVEPALELELRPADPEAALRVARVLGACELHVVVRQLVGEPRLDAVRHLHVEVVAEGEARLAVAPDDRLHGLLRPVHLLGEAVLEEVELERRLAVADDRLAVRADADLRDRAAGLARLLEPLGLGRAVEDVDAPVLCDLLEVEAAAGGDDGGVLRQRAAGGRRQGGHGQKAAAECLETHRRSSLENVLFMLRPAVVSVPAIRAEVGRNRSEPGVRLSRGRDGDMTGV